MEAVQAYHIHLLLSFLFHSFFQSNKMDKQKLIDILVNLSQTGNSLSHTFVKNIANDEFSQDDAKTLADAFKDIRSLATEGLDELRAFTSQKQK